MNGHVAYGHVVLVIPLSYNNDLKCPLFEPSLLATRDRDSLLARRSRAHHKLLKSAKALLFALLFVAFTPSATTTRSFLYDPLASSQPSSCSPSPPHVLGSSRKLLCVWVCVSAAIIPITSGIPCPGDRICCTAISPAPAR